MYNFTHPLLIIILLGAIVTTSACCDRNAQEQAKIAAATVTPVAPSASAPSLSETYPATLSEGIDFTKPGYPSFIINVSGMSGHEPWGRWTDGEKVTLQFKEPLPQKFTLVIQANAFGPNVNEAVQVKIGTTQQALKVTEQGQTHRLAFDLSASANTIELLIPKPTSPQELKVGDDPRKLGLGLIKLQILP